MDLPRSVDTSFVSGVGHARDRSRRRRGQRRRVQSAPSVIPYTGCGNWQPMRAENRWTVIRLAKTARVLAASARSEDAGRPPTRVPVAEACRASSGLAPHLSSLESGLQRSVYGCIRGLMKSYGLRLQRRYMSRPVMPLGRCTAQERRHPVVPAGGCGPQCTHIDRAVVPQCWVTRRAGLEAFGVKEIAPEPVLEPCRTGDVADSERTRSRLLQQDVGDERLGPEVEERQDPLGLHFLGGHRGLARWAGATVPVVPQRNSERSNQQEQQSNRAH